MFSKINNSNQVLANQQLAAAQHADRAQQVNSDQGAFRKEAATTRVDTIRISHTPEQEVTPTVSFGGLKNQILQELRSDSSRKAQDLQQIQTQVQSGQYQINSSEIARALL